MSGKDRTVLVDIVDQGIKSLIDRDGCGSLVYAWMMLKKELETAPEEKEEVPAPEAGEPQAERQDVPETFPPQEGEYTLPQLAELTGKCHETIRLYLKRWGVAPRRIPIRAKSDPRVAYRLTEAQLDEIRAARTRGTATGSKDSGHPLPGTAEEVPGDSGEPGEAGASGGGSGGQGRGCSGTDPDGNDHYWGSLREASEASGIREGQIKWAAAKGRTVQGWTFWYFE